MLGTIENILEFRKKTVYLYSFLLALIFLWRLPVFFEVSYAADIRIALFPLLCALLSACTVILTLTKRELQLDRFRLPLILLAAAFAWVLLRFLISRFLFENPDITLIFSRAYLAFFLFFPAAFVLDTRERKICLSFVTASWVAVMTFFALIGVICGYTGAVICVLNGSAIGITPEYAARLSFPLHPTMSAQNALTAGALALYVVLSSDRKTERIIYSLCIPVLFTACALTDSRTSIVAFALLFAALLFIFILARIRVNKVCAFLCASGAAIFTVVILYIFASFLFSQSLYLPGNNIINLKDYVNHENISSQLVEQPYAEVLNCSVSEPFFETPLSAEAVPLNEYHREIEFTFTGRSTIWKSALSALAENKGNILLFGATPYLYHQTIGLSDRFAHMHNVYLQTLVDFGLPGFIILVLFLVLFVKSAFKLIFDNKHTIAQRFVPVPAIAILFTEFMESFCRLSGDNVSLYILMFFIGLTFAEDNSVHKAKPSK